MILIDKVPGPREPDDLDLFLHPLIEELKQLEDGILTWNAYLKKEIILRAHLIVVTANISRYDSKRETNEAYWKQIKSILYILYGAWYMEWKSICTAFNF